MIESSDRTFGSYRLAELLGHGGMGEVYRAVHIHLNRPVAVKIIHPELAPDLGYASQFLQLARALANLDHPNLVKVYDADILRDRFFLVMELLLDGSLRSLWQGMTDSGQGHTLAQGVDLARQAAEGLAYAHAHGIIHGDVKPDNLLLQRRDDAGPADPTYTVKVSDFGLVHLLEEGAGSLDDAVVASPAYMSPEQWRGEEVNALSDQYSFGVVLYEAITGYLPFEARTLEDAIYKHSYAQPRPPREIVPDLPRELEEIVLRCLAKRPTDRHPSMTEVAGALTDAVKVLRADSGTVFVHQHVPEEQRTTAQLPPGIAVTPPPDSSIPAWDSSRTGVQLHVLDESGRVLQSHDLTEKGLTVGRALNNDVVLDDPAVSRRHLQLDWDGHIVTVTDCDSRHGTMLVGRRLEPNTGQALVESNWLQVARYWLWLEVPPRYLPDREALLKEKAILAPPGSERIHVALDRPALTLVPGQPAPVAVTLANMGHLVDHFTIAVEGVPSSWVDGIADKVKLNPGAHTVIMLTATVPASWQSRAGSYSVIVRASSEEAAHESGVARAVWTVLPYVRYTVDITPKRSTVWNARTTLYTVALSNDGNAPDSYAFTSKDDEQKLRYHFIPPVVARDPGEGSMATPVEEAAADPGLSARYWPLPWRRRVPAAVPISSSVAARLLVSAPWRLVGTKADRPFTVEARAASDGSIQSVKGVLSQRALIPIWLPPVAWLLLAIFVAWWYIRTQPNVQVFDVIPTAVLPGHKGTLRYEVSNAQKVEIRIHPVDAQSVEPSPIVISHPRSSHLERMAVKPLKWQDTSYQVYASNGCIWGFCVHSDASNGPILLRVLPTPTATPIPTDTPVPTALPTSIPRPTVPAPRPTAVLAPVVPPAPPASKGSTGKGKPVKPAKAKTKAAAKPKRKAGATHKSAHKKARPSPVRRSTATPILAPTPKPTARPTSTPEPPHIKPYLGTWVNIIPRPQEGTLVRLVVKRVNARTLSVHGYFSCGARVCDGGTIKVSLAGKPRSASLTSRFKVAKQQLVVTIRRVGRRLLHALVIKRINGCTMCPSGSDYLLLQPTLPRPVTTPSPTPTTSTRPGGQ